MLFRSFVTNQAAKYEAEQRVTELATSGDKKMLARVDQYIVEPFKVLEGQITSGELRTDEAIRARFHDIMSNAKDNGVRTPMCDVLMGANVIAAKCFPGTARNATVCISRWMFTGGREFVSSERTSDLLLSQSGPTGESKVHAEIGRAHV